MSRFLAFVSGFEDLGTQVSLAEEKKSLETLRGAHNRRVFGMLGSLGEALGRSLKGLIMGPPI